MTPEEHFLKTYESYQMAEKKFGHNLAFALWDSQRLWKRDLGVILSGKQGRTCSDKKAKKKRFEIFEWERRPSDEHEKRYWRMVKKTNA